MSSCQCRVSWVTQSRRVEHRRLPGDLVADGPLDTAQRVDVLGLGAGAELGRPTGRSDTFASQRSEPCSIRTSETPSARSRSAASPRTPGPPPAPSRPVPRSAWSRSRSAAPRSGCSPAASGRRRGSGRWRRRRAATCRCPPPCARARCSICTSPSPHLGPALVGDRLVVLGDLVVLRHVG